MAQKTIFGTEADQEKVAQTIAKFKCELMPTFGESDHDILDEKEPSDGPDIEGSITIRDRDAAIMFVQGIIDQFDIEREELDI